MRQILHVNHFTRSQDIMLRRSEPVSRIALMGEQPNPWDLLQPQVAMR